MSLISVIIPCFNRAEKTVRAVSSVLAQDFNDYEIIVVDDGSTDGTQNALDLFGSKIKRHRHAQNRGVSSARNTGIKNASAPYIAFLDSDDYWLPNKLAVQMQFFKSHPDRNICQTNEVWIRNGKRVNPQKKHLKPTGDIFEACLERCLVSPSAVMLKKSLLDQVGLFDETLPACEDYDLWLRIACRYPIDLVDHPLVVKEGGHPDQLSSRFKGMDRFRIKALLKIIESGYLSETQRAAALKVLSIKCKIYGDGCLKRGKSDEGRFYLQLPQRLAQKERAMK